jgi:hypothetical protein
MRIVPLRPTPSQIVSVILGGQFCKIAVYQKQSRLFCDLRIDDALVAGGRLCHDRCRIVRSVGFAGDLAFLDTRGLEDPVYTGLGGRFSLAYLSAEEVGGLG